MALYASAEWGHEIAKYIAGEPGGATVLNLLSSTADKANAIAKQAEDRFYLPWLVHKSEPSIIEKPAPI